MSNEELKPLIKIVERLGFQKKNSAYNQYTYYSLKQNDYYYSFKFVELDNIVNEILYDVIHKDIPITSRPMIISIAEAISFINYNFKKELRLLKINKLLSE